MKILFTFFWLTLSAGIVGVLILSFGKPIVSLVDLLILSDPEEVPMEKVRISTHYLQTDDGYDLFHAQLDDSNGLISIQVEGEKFILGNLKEIEEWGTGKTNPLIPPRGDKISLSLRHSIFSWYTFELSMITNRPSRKRFSYFKLTWVKADGTTLHATGKCEQGMYRRYWSKHEAGSNSSFFTIEHPKKAEQRI